MHAFSTGPYRYTAYLLHLDRCRPQKTFPQPPLCTISSPLAAHLSAWRRRLQSHPDQEFASFILQGIAEGFRVGYSYSQQLRSAKRNMPSALEHPEVVERYLGEESRAGRILGPFQPGSIPNLHISRFGVIPKG